MSEVDRQKMLWLAIRRALLVIVVAIEKAYNLPPTMTKASRTAQEGKERTRATQDRRIA